MKVIENWSITPCPRNPYLAPEMRKPCLQGVCEDMRVITSPILGRKGDNILTQNTEYKLGSIDPFYEESYPDAFSRLLNSLKVL